MYSSFNNDYSTLSQYENNYFYDYFEFSNGHAQEFSVEHYVDPRETANVNWSYEAISEIKQNNEFALDHDSGNMLNPSHNSACEGCGLNHDLSYVSNPAHNSACEGCGLNHDLSCASDPSHSSGLEGSNLSHDLSYVSYPSHNSVCEGCGSNHDLCCVPNTSHSSTLEEPGLSHEATNMLNQSQNSPCEGCGLNHDSSNVPNHNYEPFPNTYSTTLEQEFDRNSLIYNAPNINQFTSNYEQNLLSYNDCGYTYNSDQSTMQ